MARWLPALVLCGTLAACGREGTKPPPDKKSPAAPPTDTAALPAPIQAPAAVSAPSPAPAPRPASPPAGPEAGSGYETRCEVAQAQVNGYVSNKGTDTYQVSGITKFVLNAGDGISRMGVGAMANAIVGPKETALVATAPLNQKLDNDEACRFEVEGAIRKLSR